MLTKLFVGAFFALSLLFTSAAVFVEKPGDSRAADLDCRSDCRADDTQDRCCCCCCCLVGLECCAEDRCCCAVCPDCCDTSKVDAKPSGCCETPKACCDPCGK